MAIVAAVEAPISHHENTSHTSDSHHLNYYPAAQRLGQLKIYNGNEIDHEIAQIAISAINHPLGWSHDNDEIFESLKTRPHHCFFPVINNKIQGYAVVREEGAERHLHISYIAVDSKGGGIGTKLMQHIMEENKRLGKTKLSLHFRKDNESLKRFYTRLTANTNMSYQIVDKQGKDYFFVYENKE